MRKMTVSVLFFFYYLGSIEFYTGRKDTSMEAELKDCVNKIYEKYVPAQTREYIESIGAVERPSRTSRSVPQPRPENIGERHEQ